MLKDFIPRVCLTVIKPLFVPALVTSHKIKRLKQQRVLLLHEVMHFRVDPINDGHQIVKNMFCVVHGGIHEVPEEEDKTEGNLI